MSNDLNPEFKARTLANFTALRDALNEVLANPGKEPPAAKLKEMAGMGLGVNLDARSWADKITGRDEVREKVWEQVKNKKDWKKPVNAVIIRSAKELAEDAILFYTGSIATFEGVSGKPAYIRVRAPGYYAAQSYDG